jgi:predicted esterase
VYGQSHPKKINLEMAGKAGVPIAMFTGKHDTIVYPSDSEWIRDKLGSSVVEYTQIDGGHTVYFLGKDATFVKKNILNLMNKYNPL